MRLLTIGSHDWHDVDTIHQALGKYVWEPDVTLIFADYPRGADVICGNYAASLKWKLELYPPDWNTYGDVARSVSNAQMIQVGADICYAFLVNHDRMGMQLATLAKNKGIKTEVFYKTEF